MALMFRLLSRRKAPRTRWVEARSALDIRRSCLKTINRTPDLSDWRIGSRFVDILFELREGTFIHRKSWEYGLCIEGLEQLGVVRPDAVALAVGAGYERPLFYFANKIARMVATDLYDNPLHEGKPDMLTEPWKFAHFDYRRAHLEVMRMSGDALNFPDETFNFVFCLSSIEHFGTRETIAKALSEIKRVLKRDGVACIITEVVLEGAAHPEYFTPDELRSMFLSDPTFHLVGGQASLVVAEELLQMPVDIHDPDDLNASPHIVLSDGERLWTSFSMFLQKR